ncbi:GDP-L-fucose synthase family protein [Puniceicoccus vermicola]|uniref:GDP-L-fucose synthase n=1 Tax=Puniceicoccus vermicola TaxID=388746 RepID=A0A7X1B200_9BACT|nr:GDP-L-fucose synthase [Puniceicoccus vermicola]MBC2604165.1 GDP-L-fucose synthase [Puniceicoccus vermicola]
MTPDSKIFVAGHRGMVGSGVVRKLKAAGFTNIITVRRTEVDLTREEPTLEFLMDQRPDVVVNSAAKVGGIYANNTYPAEFLHENLAMGLNLVHGSYKAGVGRLLNLGSTCIYPREAPQPIPEDSLLTSPLEKTNEAYALAKIAILKLCQYYRKQYGVLFHSAMPTNLYGTGDNYHPENSHVLPGLIRRFHEAAEAKKSEVVVWGTGTPLREFLHVDDLAEAVLHLLSLENPPDWVNVGTGVDCSIRELAETIASVVGFQGELVFDPSKPDGTPRKLTDISRIRETGWDAKISLKEGLERTYREFCEGLADGSVRL